MLKKIQKIKNLGVFSDYSRPAEMKDFAVKNIIYGWNYSGKTTISRIFGLLENKKKRDFNDLKFTFIDANNDVINERNYQTNTKIIQVFNSDFVANNLSFAGDAFNPVLLLGEESKEAEEKIEELDKKLTQCLNDIRKCDHAESTVLRTISTAKTQESAEIKRRIRLVPAFGTTQLDQYIRTVQRSDENFSLSDDELDSTLSIAHRADADKLQPVAKSDTELELSIYHTEASTLLLKKPEFTNTIDYLIENKGVGSWVEMGLSLHEDKEECEFCGNTLGEERLSKLQAHFSKDLVNHKAELNALILKVKEARISDTLLPDSKLNNQFHKRLQEINKELGSSIRNYNLELDKVVNALQQKVDDPFVIHELESLDESHQAKLKNDISSLNILIDENNLFCENFEEEKRSAVERLKLHFTQNFIIRIGLDKQIERTKTLQRRIVVSAKPTPYLKYFI